MHILYFAHDVNDATVKKRVAMLHAGGATVALAGFSRSAQWEKTVDGSSVTCLGVTQNGQFTQRIRAVVQALRILPTRTAVIANADYILARNLEMLALAVRAQKLSGKNIPIVYECLDIHRLMLRPDPIGIALRLLEGWLSKRACMLITSSPAFVREYFHARAHVRLATRLVENKVFIGASSLAPAYARRTSGPPWRIGWFGALRCSQSFALLRELANTHPGLVEITLRGKPAYDQLPDFELRIAETPNMQYLGPYRNPEDLGDIYSAVHFSWAIDLFEEGQNSSWLLPNRLYEGGLYGAVPIAAQGVETSRRMSELSIGHILFEPKCDALHRFFTTLTDTQYQQMADALRRVPLDQWRITATDCAALVEALGDAGVRWKRRHEIPTPTPRTEEDVNTLSVLLVIPCLNETAHLEGLVTYLLNETETLQARIVIADGGSTDGTVAIAQRLAEAHANVCYLHNPKRIQSAAVNLAVETFGEDYTYLLRVDAHAEYPSGYCRTLLQDAHATGADSVVVRMHTVGRAGRFQQAAAAAQNSKLGNGGAAHRGGEAQGKFVDHGHHALMRIAAYRAVGGYDERFTHNEDAELDIRLRAAGSRIWLTGKTTLTYFPRATPLALFRQYRGYGRGRARTLLKHRMLPKLRQTLPVAVVPAKILLLLSPWLPLAALPLLLWAALCLGYGGLLALKAKNPWLALSGPAAMLMHAAWSLGFWQSLLNRAAWRLA